MSDFLLQTEILPFTIALGLMVGISLLEGITTLLGAGLSNFLESFLPDTNTDIDVDLDANVETDSGIDADASHSLSQFLGWLHVGQVPILVLLVLFLFGFAILGFLVQALAQHFLGRCVPGLVAVIPACLGAMGTVHFGGKTVAHLIPRDETDAVSEGDFVGQFAQITLGTAREGKPAEAKLRDRHGHTHYVMVEPEMGQKELNTGTEILLVRRQGAIFYAVTPPDYSSPRL